MPLNGHLLPGDWAFTLETRAFYTLGDAQHFVEFGTVRVSSRVNLSKEDPCYYVPEGCHCTIISSGTCGSNNEGRVYLSLITLPSERTITGWVISIDLVMASREPPTYVGASRKLSGQAEPKRT